MKTMIRLVLTVFFLPAFLFSSAKGNPVNPPPSSPSKPRRPNIVFLLCDDLQAFALGCTGHPVIRTPNIDRLAQRGVLFNRCYASSSICMPSRATIFTGLYEFRHGCNFNQPGLDRKTWQTRSYPFLLRQAGYRTAFAGKWGVHFRDRYDASKDFDRWGALKGGQGYYETRKNPNLSAYAERYPHVTRALAAFACDFIRDQAGSDRPFCLSISFKAPHKPHNYVDPRDAERYKDVHFPYPPNYGDAFAKLLPMQPRLGRQRASWPEWNPAHYQKHMRTYAQLISGIDAAVGRIIDELDKQGMLDNTVIIFTSDNGYSLGAHGLQGKALPYEEPARIPLIISMPGGKRGAQCSRLTANLDMEPTILSAAGIPVPADSDGRNLLPLVKDPDAQPVHDHIFIIQNWGAANSDLNKGLAVVTARWKYIFWPYGDPNVQPAEELYDLQNDRYETNELFRAQAANPEVVSVMHRAYDKFVNRIRTDHAPGYDFLADLFDRHIPWQKKKFHPSPGRYLKPELYRRVTGKEPPPGVFKDFNEHQKTDRPRKKKKPSSSNEK